VGSKGGSAGLEDYVYSDDGGELPVLILSWCMCAGEGACTLSGAAAGRTILLLAMAEALTWVDHPLAGDEYDFM
jgi:hypothetical protein